MKHRGSSIGLVVVAATVASLVGGVALAGTPHLSGGWHDTKCQRYRTAWSHALERLGTRGLSPAFLTSHDAFLASNCTKRADVCPRSADELKLANILVIMTMNFGTASTFVPFACR